MRKIVFISSLSHSGSTLLDLILGGHSRFIGLGEIRQVLDLESLEREKINKVVCSCTHTLEECAFWGKAVPKLRNSGKLSNEERYQIILETFCNIFGKDCIPVDSSKYNSSLRMLHADPVIDLRVLHLIRDVRSFTISHIDNQKRKPREHKRRSPLHYFKKWYSGNKKIQNFLKTKNISHFQLGYEELCHYPDMMIEKICDYLDEKPEPSMLTIENSKSHNVLGNRMRRQSDKLKLLYDIRWFQRNEWLVPSLLFPKIMKYNTSQVYRNVGTRIWDT